MISNKTIATCCFGVLLLCLLSALVAGRRGNLIVIGAGGGGKNNHKQHDSGPHYSESKKLTILIKLILNFLTPFSKLYNSTVPM